MSPPQQGPPAAHLTPHLRALVSDLWVRSALGILAVHVILSQWFQQGTAGWWALHLPPVLLAGTVFGALWWRLDQVRQPNERLFWNDLAAACGALLAATILRTGHEIPWLAVASDLFYVAFFIIFVLALERRPHRHHPWRPGSLDRNLSWPALMVFVLSLLTYLVFQPLAFQHYQPRIASTWLAWVLDGFLTIRLVLVAVKSSSLRWQNLYTVLAMAMALATGRDLWQALTGSTSAINSGDLLLAGLPWVLLVVAARLRLRRFPADALIEEERADAGISSPAGQGLVFALALPLLHFTYKNVVDDPIADTYRETLLLAACLALGILSYLQYQRLRSGMQNLRQERALFEEELLESEQDLRLMVEQKQTTETLDTFERAFVDIFYRNPDAIAICTLADGDFLEVNDAFADLFGFARQEMMGQTALELGLLTPGDDFDRLMQRLQQHEMVRQVQVACRHRDGHGLSIEMSAQRVEIEGQLCMLIVTLLTQPAAPSPASEHADWLAGSTDSAWVTDDAGLITYWNEAAATLLGWPEERALGQPIEQILDTPEHQEILRCVDGEGHWSGELEAVHVDGRRLRLHCRYLLLQPDGDGPKTDPAQPPGASRLAICRAFGDGETTQA